MNVRLLIDGVVRQTTILIAQLSTAAGVRAPLARVADQVFLDLAREIEAQGIGRKVVADMFGLALRSYQKKVQRLTESTTERNKTLWQATLEFLRDGSKTRRRIADRFINDGDREIGAVLNDLVSSGLVYCTGRGDTALYGRTSDADLNAVVASEDTASVANLAWLYVFLGETTTEAALVERLGVDPPVVAAAVELCVREQRLMRREDATLAATNVVIPVGATDGWEAAIIDHFRAVATAIASKAAGDPAEKTDEIGGTTLSFSLHGDHPDEAEVRALLARVRVQVNELWQRVVAYNDAHPEVEEEFKVTFYFGQSIIRADSEVADPRHAVSAEMETVVTTVRT